MTPTDFKDPEEIVDLSFDFAKDLGGSAINVGSPVVAASVVSGADPDPANTIQGAPLLQATIVFQRMRLGLDRVNYKFRCKITASDGRVLVLSLQVPVRTV